MILVRKNDLQKADEAIDQSLSPVVDQGAQCIGFYPMY